MTPREQELTEQLLQCQEALQQARRENELLRQKIDSLVRRLFGSSSEQLDPAQLDLLLQVPINVPAPTEAAPAPAIPQPAPAPRRKPREPRLPENLPVVEEVIEPEVVRAQPEKWRCIGVETSEQLDYEPGRFLRRRTIRRKYAHRTEPDQAPVIAPLPERLLHHAETILIEDSSYAVTA